MSTHHRRKIDHEQGTMKSYVVGFILSLVFTFIPYYLVTHHSIAGTWLLITILEFAVLQMIIQIVFFLHLGRGPKPRWNLFFFIATVGIILVVVGGSILIINNLHYNMQPADQTKKLVNDEAIYQLNGEKTGACQGGKHTNYQVVIKDNLASPSYVVAHKCDSLTFLNQDSKVREIAFGRHPGHEAYAGETELMARKGIGKTITLSEAGTYQFHDHLNPDVNGFFTVKDD